MTFQDPHLVRGKGGSSKKIQADGLRDFFADIGSRYRLDQITFLCIGTDRSSGDALGPLTGSELQAYGFPSVIGTLSAPCDASSLEACIAAIPEGHIVIAVDACLGQSHSVGSFLVSDEPIFPAQSVGHTLPAVGHYSIAAVVNVKGPKPYATLQMTSLFHVMSMAGQIASSEAGAFGLRSQVQGFRFNGWPLA